MVARQTLKKIISVAQGFAHPPSGYGLWVVSNNPFFKSSHDRIGQAFSQFGSLLKIQILIVRHLLNLVEFANLLQCVLSSVLVFLEAFMKFTACMRPAT